MKIFETILDYASRALAFLASLSLLAMLVHVCADVIFDYGLNSPIPGTAEIVAYYYMVAAVFLPLPLLEMRNGSINVDLFYGMANRPTQRGMLRISYFVQLVFFSILAWQSGIDALEAITKGELVEGRINVFIWPGRVFLPVALTVAALVSLLLLIRAFVDRNFDPDDLADDEADMMPGGVS